MSRFPMSGIIAKVLDERPDIAMADGDTCVTLGSKALTLMNTIAREVAQFSWNLRQFEDDRDDLMVQDLDELARQAMCIPWWKFYPELPHQVDRVVRDAFDDEHFRLEDPEGWAEVNADLPVRVLH